MLNNFTVMGRLVADPELKTTPGGVSVCSFRIACSRNFKNANGEYDADFFTCTAWRNTAEYVARNSCKGQIVTVQGSVHINTVNKDGRNISYTEITADNVFLGAKSSQGTAEATSSVSSGSDYDYSDLDLDDPELPFNN